MQYNLFRKKRWFCGMVLLMMILLGCQKSGVSPSLIPPLVTPASPKFLQGKFLWYELVSHDIDTAKQFYGRLFGWSFTEVGLAQNRYHVISNRGTYIGGIVHDPDMGKAAQWIGFISTENPDRLAKSVVSEGGEIVVPPGIAPDLGRYVVFKDPQGAVLGGLKSFSGDPPDTLPQAGAWIWAELWSTDPQQAAEFYKELLDYRVFQDTGTEQPDNYILVSNGFARAGVVPTLYDDTPPFWLPYVRVESMKQAVDTAKQSGGTILFEPEADVFTERIAILADPTGGVFALLELPNKQEIEGREIQ